MENQLEAIAKSYDKAIDLGRRGGDAYKDLPSYITEDPRYPLFQKMEMDGRLSDSGSKEIIEYLAPITGMKFVDLGCCLNLMFRGYQDWPSTYYGVDISSKTIELLHEFAKKKNIKGGAFYCGSIHDTPFDTNFFDIGACIGILEYFKGEFVEQAIKETHRIIKPDGKLVLDIPDVGSSEFEITALIEEYLSRPDKFNMSIEDFGNMLSSYFEIDKKEKVGPMIQYFLRCKK